MQIGIQLYTLRNLDESLPETIERVGETPFDGVQLSGFWGATPDETAAAIADADLEVAGAHVDLNEIEDAYEEVLMRYGVIGCDEFVVPSYHRTAFESESAAREAGRELASVATRLTADGVTLHYHNHTFEM